MGNLSLTINAFQTLTNLEDLNQNALLFITSNGVFTGKVVHFDGTDINVENANDLVLKAYSNALEFGLDSERFKNHNFEETILLKDAKFKLGKIIVNLPYTALNINQIVSVQLVQIENLDQLLDSL